jgi:hypothetical protein
MWRILFARRLLQLPHSSQQKGQESLRFQARYWTSNQVELGVLLAGPSAAAAPSCQHVKVGHASLPPIECSDPPRSQRPRGIEFQRMRRMLCERLISVIRASQSGPQELDQEQRHRRRQGNWTWVKQRCVSGARRVAMPGK